MRVVDVFREWSWEQFEPYRDAVIMQFGRLAERFPNDVTVDSLKADCVSGDKWLWLVIDDEECLAACCMTRIRTSNATGKRMASLLDLAGDCPDEWAAQLCAKLEEWAEENNAPIMEIEGREGWKPLLRKFGYRPYAVLYRKVN